MGAAEERETAARREIGRSALIVGNTDGIGLGLTKRLLGEGWKVTGVSRRASTLESPGYTHGVHDVSAPTYPAWIEAVVQEIHALDLCVFCAGIGQPLDIDDLGPEYRTILVNFAAAVATISAVLPGMQRAGNGQVIALSSLADGILDSIAPSYAASKAGLSSYLANLHALMCPHGVAVTNVRFGFVDTKMARAPRKPMMISVERAVDLICECIESRPAQRTYPRTADLIVKLIGVSQLPRLWGS